MSESSDERRPKRQKRETSYKAKAFEKFKQLKNGLRNKYEVEEMEDIYETLDEKEYVKRVLDRQDDDWIVDDDGSGYVEDGREIFDDDLDSESISKASSKSKGHKKKKAVSDGASKGNIQYMLSNMNVKKKEETTQIEDDNMLSEILGEIDETPSCSFKDAKKFIPRKQIAQDYMKKFPMPLKKPSTACESPKSVQIDGTYDSPKRIQLKGTHNSLKKPEIEDMDIIPQENQLNQAPSPEKSSDNGIPTISPEPEENDVEMTNEDEFDDNLDISQIEQIESQFVQSENENYSISENFTCSFNSDFAMEDNSFSNHTNSSTEDKNLNVPFVEHNDKKVFRFFWWDAFEDPEKQRGTVFLFGKTYSKESKTYASCCVAVKNINRQVFLLPRTHILDDDYRKTDRPVTFKDLYLEFKSLIADPMQIKDFKSKFVQKKYAFDPSVPRESDYLEVIYPATEPRIDPDSITETPKTFSKIFGINTSNLERFLIDGKIKGPCWLDISSPQVNTNPLSWCKFEINCTSPKNVIKVNESIPPPPLTLSALNFRLYINPRTNQNEILMISCVTQSAYEVDRKPPDPPFNDHFCVFTSPSTQTPPLNIHEYLKKYKGTRVQKMDSEKAVLNYFVTQFNKIDPDFIVGHDLQGYQNDVLAKRLIINGVITFSKLSRLKRSQNKKLDREMFTGRLVCDVKISAKELIKSRSYDLETLCQQVLKIPENQRVDLEPDEIPKLYENAQDIIKLIMYTMQDASYILKILYDLNVIPLALQITNIAGNVMSKTLMGGRSERNEFLLLHAFYEKDYITPDKRFNRNSDNKKVRKKPTYSGGLVLEPKVGFYDKLLLLMDFNSLYPSIIQEYNICFTTLPVTENDENLVLPDSQLPPGILPVEIRKLVDSRKQVKGLMANPDLSPDLKMQYHIRQMALKLTANSMYGCLGFSNSRFYARNLAALVTQKGREILMNTKDLVEKMCFEVVYGDTDSIMINTNLLEFDQVLKIGHKIKQEVNKLYKMIELDIDGIFKYLLLLKKKKYAAVTITKGKDGKLKEEKEYKGLDIVRRDWSQLASEAGKFVLEHILSDQSPDDRLSNIQNYLTKLQEDLKENKVPLPLLVITKQLTKDPNMYPNKDALPHVHVALRYNTEHGGHFRAGDTVCYIICEDGSTKSATQRAYHPEELKTNENLKIDIKYYLAQQIHPVVARICDPIEGIDSYLIAQCLGLDAETFKKPTVQILKDVGENIIRPEVKFRNVDKFTFKCLHCGTDNIVNGALNGDIPFLSKCSNNNCTARPIDYLYYIQNQLTLSIGNCISKYYQNKLICEDPACPNETTRTPVKFSGKFPICTMCESGVMYREYTERELFTQLCYYVYIFDLHNVGKKPLMEDHINQGYQQLREIADKFLNSSGYAIVDLTEVFEYLLGQKTTLSYHTSYEG